MIDFGSEIFLQAIEKIFHFPKTVPGSGKTFLLTSALAKVRKAAFRSSGSLNHKDSLLLDVSLCVPYFPNREQPPV